MRPIFPNRPFRRRYLAIACLTLVIGIGFSPAFQTWACRLALNHATLEQDLRWSVGNVSIGLFPISIELADVRVTHPGSTDLQMKHAAIRIADIDGPNWHIEHFDIQGIDGVLFAQSDSTKTSQSSVTTNVQLFLDAATVSDVHVVVCANQAAVDVEWDVLNLEELKWAGANLKGALHLPQARISPVSMTKDSWSGAWDAPTDIQGFNVNFHCVDSLQQFTLQTDSNWGRLFVEWRSNQAQQAIAFEAVPRFQEWPIQMENWLSELPSVVSDSVVTGHFTWDAQAKGRGFLSQLDVDVPLAFQGSTWKAGPIEINSAQLEFAANLAGLSLPRYFSSHSNWLLEIGREETKISARLTPEKASNQKLQLTWNTAKNQTELSAELHGFVFDVSNQDLSTGDWKLNWYGHPQDNRWEGNLTASHPLGDTIKTEWDASWNPSAWSISTETRVKQLAPHAESSSPWELFARIGWRASGTDWENWTQLIEVRDIVLLENRAPRVFDRFDAIQKRSGDAWELEWISAVTSGTAKCNTAFLTNWSFNPNQLAFESKDQGPSIPPHFNLEVNVSDLQPIALLANLPLTTRQPFAAEARWNGENGMLSTRIPSLSFGNVTAEHLSIEAALHMNQPSILKWETRGLALNDIPIIEEASGQFEADTTGLELAIQTFTSQIGGEVFTLDEPSVVLIDYATSSLSLSAMPLLSAGGSLDFSGAFLKPNDWNVQARIIHEGFQLGSESNSIDEIDGTVRIQSDGGVPQIGGSLRCKKALWNKFTAVEAEVMASGPVSAPHLELRTSSLPSGNIFAALDLPIDDLNTGQSIIAFTDIDLASVNDLLPPASVELFGKVSGELTVQGFDAFPLINGRIVPEDLTLIVPYLGTRYRGDGVVKVQANGFFMDQWTLCDGDSAKARFNGTVMHNAFKEWDLDFGIEINDRPIELMNIPITDDALFYGTARGIGDINVSGFGPVLQIDASIKTGEGTDFALPMDSRSDVDYADFVRFEKHDAASDITATPRGTFSNTRMNLGIDLDDGAQARIVFDRKVGDEIVGNAIGHLDLEVNDFEQLDMTGSLEITDGAYHFTLQNWFNKRFDIQPGSTVSWEGDPYDAQLNVATTYTTRTSLDPLLPDIDDLPGRIPVDLQLQLEGSLMRPGLDFNVAVPTADSRTKALVEGALISEEEVQRQALGLLTLNQFIPSDPTEAAIGGFIQPAQSTQFLANQIGHWISQIAPSMDVGLDYAQDALSGEQALGLALSTQLLNDRLHIEGEVGAQTFGAVNAEDFQIQDLTVSFDLTDDGGIQLTGHSRQNASLTNTIEGDAVQGVGIRFKWAFDEWGGWKKQ